MAYTELIKNFEKIRAYMREFYVYGFKSRSEYNAKSARSYDDERRRLESWLGDHMRFTQTADGKNVFLSVDSRATAKNPFYKAWKAKSFTDGDITLHFAIFDVLYAPEIKMTLAKLVDEIDKRLSSRLTFDESTLRKKLKEYVGEGIIQAEKAGRRVLYSRSPDTDISSLSDVIDFFSEAAPCGVIGSFLQDKEEPRPEMFFFKHHYITQAMDSDAAATLFDAMRRHAYVTFDNLSRYSNTASAVRAVPLRIYISAQGGRQHLLAFSVTSNRLRSYRLDYISNVRAEADICENFTELRKALEKAEKHMWGVGCRWDTKHTEHVEFEIRVGEGEEHIVRRLEREKRCGHVERTDDSHCLYAADVFDTTEMLPWIRTFISRITRLDFSNRTAENKFREDLREMYRMYGIDGGENVDIQ